MKTFFYNLFMLELMKNKQFKIYLYMSFNVSMKIFHLIDITKFHMQNSIYLLIDQIQNPILINNDIFTSAQDTNH